MDSAYAVGYLIGYIIVGIIFGAICKAIASNRGMEGGFWWGFWLWIIGIIVVAVRPNENNSVPAQAVSSPYEDLERLANLKAQGVLSDEEYAKMKAECLSRIN